MARRKKANVVVLKALKNSIRENLIKISKDITQRICFQITSRNTELLIHKFFLNELLCNFLSIIKALFVTRLKFDYMT
jgi:hypothetical protein